MQVHEIEISTQLMLMQQHPANRILVSDALTSLSMDRTTLRQKTRREAFKGLRKSFESNIKMAEALGEEFSPSYVSQLLNGHRGIGDDVATKIEQRLDLEFGYLDKTPPELESQSDGKDKAKASPFQNKKYPELVEMESLMRNTDEMGRREMLAAAREALRHLRKTPTQINARVIPFPPRGEATRDHDRQTI